MGAPDWWTRGDDLQPEAMRRALLRLMGWYPFVWPDLLDHYAAPRTMRCGPPVRFDGPRMIQLDYFHNQENSTMGDNDQNGDNRNDVTALTTRMQELGKSALESARETLKKEYGDRFVGRIKELLARLDRIRETRGVLAVQEDFCRRRIAAIEAGAFSVVADQLLFNDDELNKTSIIRGNTVIGLE